MTIFENTTIKKIIVAALATLLVLLIVALIINLVRLSAANRREAELARKRDMLQAVYDENRQFIDVDSKSPEYIEAYAREYLDMVRRGEIIIDIK